MATPLPAPADQFDPALVSRTACHLVTPSMCGHNSLLIGRIGDWTWQLVGDACGVDVLTARSADGRPTYLSFCYYRIVGSRRFHLRSPEFGDRLDVRSGVFGLGSESVVVLHELRRHGPGIRTRTDPVDPDEFFRFDDPDCLYVEHYNRWVSRGAAGSNNQLVQSSPAGFRHEHLPSLPGPHSPRIPFRRALTTGTVRTEPVDPVGRCALRFPVDVTRDLNGAGLLYFASYFSIVDRALLEMWRRLGLDTASFLGRVVLDQQMCLQGNADADTILAVEVGWGAVTDGRRPVEVTVADGETGRAIAACALDVLEPQAPKEYAQ